MFITLNCVCACGYACGSEWGKKRVSGPLELQLGVVSSLMCTLETELGFWSLSHPSLTVWDSIWTFCAVRISHFCLEIICRTRLSLKPFKSSLWRMVLLVGMETISLFGAIAKISTYSQNYSYFIIINTIYVHIYMFILWQSTVLELQKNQVCT